MECVCFTTTTAHRGQEHRAHCDDPAANRRMPGLKDIDLCEIAKRTEDKNSRHNDHECHLKGERRQNLINKIKMFLDDYDDRPVMKAKGGESNTGKALGQTGFGPLLKYPGYVDYDHPYFSDPYNKMPTLAMTVGQRGQNPCLPIRVSNSDACYTASTLDGQEPYTEAHAQDGGDRCRCAERNGEEPRCPAARNLNLLS